MLQGLVLQSDVQEQKPKQLPSRRGTKAHCLEELWCFGATVCRPARVDGVNEELGDSHCRWPRSPRGHSLPEHEVKWSWWSGGAPLRRIEGASSRVSVAHMV
jgi:hypothetical protein